MLIGGGEAGRGVAIATIAVPIALAVNSRALEAKGSRDISQLIDAASARAVAQQGSMSGSESRSDLAMDVPGWRRFAPTERPFNSDTPERAARLECKRHPSERQAAYSTRKRWLGNLHAPNSSTFPRIRDNPANSD